MSGIYNITDNSPVFIEPNKWDLDKPIISPVSTLDEIRLHGDDARTFWGWVREYWCDLFEKNLQGMATDDEYGPLLTTWIPLTTFRYHVCRFGGTGPKHEIDALIEFLLARTRNWRSHEADEVFISGCDARPIR